MKKIREDKKCLMCDNMFTPKRSDSKNCSKKCSRKYLDNYDRSLATSCGKCQKVFGEDGTIRGTHKYYCDVCWKKYQREHRIMKAKFGKERKKIILFENKVKYLLNKIELNGGDISLNDMNDLIQYYQLTFSRIDCKGNTMGEQILDMYESLIKKYESIIINKPSIDLR